MNKFIICGFSGVGKSTAEQKHNNVVDFESSAYSHILDDSHLIEEKNPDFPRNYIDALCRLIDEGKGDVFLLSCHEEVRQELKERGLDYIIVKPTIDQENEYLKRWLKRGSSIEFIKMMSAKWYSMHKSCEDDKAPKIYLNQNEYIDDVLPR